MTDALRLQLRAMAARLAWWRPVHQVLLGPQGCWSSLPARPPQHWPDWAAWCAAHTGARAQVWLDAAWLHEVSCDPSLPLPDDRAVAAYARQLLVHYHGERAQDWPLGAWRSPGGCGATALHHSSGTGLVAQAQAHQVHLCGLAPWWRAVLDRQLGPGAGRRTAGLAPGRTGPAAGGLGSAVDRSAAGPGPLPTGQHALAGRTDAGCAAAMAGGPSRPARHTDRLTGLASCGRRTDAEPGAERHHQVHARPCRVDRHPGHEPHPGHGPDLLQRSPAPPRVAWVALLACALVASTAGWNAWASWGEMRNQARALTRWEAARDKAMQHHSAAQGPAGASAAVPPAGAGAWAVATARALNHPWHALLAGVEAGAQPGIEWTALEHAGASGQVRLTGLAPDRAAALGLPPLLAAQPHWQAVALRQLGADEAAAGRLRFELQAVLENPAQPRSRRGGPMKALRDELARWGWVGIACLALLGAAMLLELVHERWQAEREALAEQGVAVRQQISRAAELANIDPVQDPWTALRVELPLASERERRVAELLALAERQGLKLWATDLEQTTEPALGVEKLQVRQPARGTYRQIRAWLEAALAADAALSLDQISLRRKGAEAEEVEADVVWTLYQRTAGAAP